MRRLEKQLGEIRQATKQSRKRGGDKKRTRGDTDTGNKRTRRDTAAGKSGAPDKKLSDEQHAARMKILTSINKTSASVRKVQIKDPAGNRICGWCLLGALAKVPCHIAEAAHKEQRTGAYADSATCLKACPTAEKYAEAC